MSKFMVRSRIVFDFFIFINFFLKQTCAPGEFDKHVLRKKTFNVTVTQSIQPLVCLSMSSFVSFCCSGCGTASVRPMPVSADRLRTSAGLHQTDASRRRSAVSQCRSAPDRDCASRHQTDAPQHRSHTHPNPGQRGWCTDGAAMWSVRARSAARSGCKVVRFSGNVLRSWSGVHFFRQMTVSIVLFCCKTSFDRKISVKKPTPDHERSTFLSPDPARSAPVGTPFVVG